MANLPRRQHLERRETGMIRCGLKIKPRSGMPMWDALADSFLDLPLLSIDYRLHESFICENYRDEAPGELN
jgi:hypothetical protein